MLYEKPQPEICRAGTVHLTGIPSSFSWQAFISPSGRLISLPLTCSFHNSNQISNNFNVEWIVLFSWVDYLTWKIVVATYFVKHSGQHYFDVLVLNDQFTPIARKLPSTELVYHHCYDASVLHTLTSRSSVVGWGRVLQNQGGLLNWQQVLSGLHPAPSHRGSAG